MRTQYLIWNKDSVADETIFADIEKLSDYRLKVPADITLGKVSQNASFARPTLGINVGQQQSGKKNRKWNNRKGGKR